MTWQSTKQRVAAFAAVSVLSTLGAASLGLSPAAAAVPSAQTTTAFCVNVPAGFGGFTDISGSIHRKTIECLAFSEITTGKTATTFAPGDPVTRGQMASFIARAIDKANELERVALPSLPANPPDKFSDDNGSGHESSINRLAAAGIVSGTTATTFSPSGLVTRGQMATFINNTQRFLSGGTPFTTNQDYFVDDETSPHEANINGIASAGITAGVDATHYAPSALVLRANMATFITRYLAVLHKYGIINALGAGNSNLTFTPTAAARLIGAAEPSTTDDRTYTASGLAAGTTYRVTLFQRSLVSVDPGPVYTFTEEGSTGVANAGTVGGRIVAVKGTAVTAAQSVGAITPANGSITVTVDAVDYSQLLPVIFTDQGGSNTGLNLDAQDKPSEPFGVGGELETLPEPAATGVLAGDATVVFADETANLIVGQIASTQRTYLYDTTGDTFYRDSVAPANSLTLAQFEAALSKGDRLDATTSYQSAPASASIFVLENVSPPAPTATAGSITETTAVITITDLIAGATAKVYLGADGAAFGASPLKATATADANTSSPGFQVSLTGLTAGTSYEFYATQTVSGEESDPTTKVAGPSTSLTTAAATPPTVTSASLSAPRTTLTVNFSETVTPTTLTADTAGKFSVVCAFLGLPTSTTAGATIAVQDTDTLVVTLTGAVPDDGLSTCTASVAAGAVHDGSNTPNNAQSGVAL